MIILDTNVVSTLMRDHPDDAVMRWLDNRPSSSVWTTTITVFEGQFGIATMSIGRRRDAMAAAFERVIADDLGGRVLAFEQVDAERAAHFVARRRALGYTDEIRDSMIAGITIARRAILATRNIKHFTDSAIDLVDPWNS